MTQQSTEVKMTDDTHPAAVGIHPREWEDAMRAENDRLRDDLAEVQKRIIAELQAENADLQAKLDAANADAERLAAYLADALDAQGPSTIGTMMRVNGRAAIAAHEARKGK